MSGDSVPWTLSLSRFTANDREATILFGELRKPLLRYLACLGLSSDEAQDVVQDAFLRLHSHLHAGGSQENIRSWLFRVAHNQARNHQSSYHRRFSDPLEPDTTGQLLDEATPERALLEKEKFQRLGAAIRTLGNSERECLLLRASGLAVSRNRRSIGNSDVHGGRHGGSRDQETGGEMQCVTIQGN